MRNMYKQVLILAGSQAVFQTVTILLIEIYPAFTQFYRFAAGEVATMEFRIRAISPVIAGGVVAAFAGPWLGRTGSNLLSAPYTGSFVLMGVMSVIGVLLLPELKVPEESHTAALDTPPAGRWTTAIILALPLLWLGWQRRRAAIAAN